MVKFDEGGTIDLKKSSLKDMSEFFATEAVSRLMVEGGKGVRGAIWEAMYTAIQWSKVQENK